MLFWISLAFLLLPLVGLAAGLFLGNVERRESSGCWIDVALGAIGGAGAASVAALFLSMPALTAWASYADEVSKVEAQHHRIEVYTERIESLEQRLSDFDYPSKPTISVDSDTPWASMVKSLNGAESELARAKDERAIAIRSIRARMRGPMSGVVSFVGLPDGWGGQ